ncbi:DUF5049 domain-containing protein [Desulfoglaeba alkanexedens]|nr:DUF5049 domain-containing protein [Desulfoglaeba alkanexedens]
MRVLIKNTDLAGNPLEGEGEVFTGKTSLEIVRAMKGAALFSDQGSFEDYIDMLLRNTKMLAGIDLMVKGDNPEEKADSLLAALIEHGLAEVLEDDAPVRIPVPALVWQGVDAVRLSGLTNMLDRPEVVRIARKLDFTEAAGWIDAHPKEYAEGVFRGFVVEPDGGKS